MSSTNRGVAGGSFGRNQRFKTATSSQTPGQKYNLKSQFETEHRSAPLYKAPNVINPGSDSHPSVGRTGFMVGTTKNDINYYNSTAGVMGPNKYYPGLSLTKHQAARPVFGTKDRFNGNTKQYISKDHNVQNLCTEGPGPMYLNHDNTSNTNLNTNSAPHYSFRSRGDRVSNRSAFLSSSLKSGYIYQSQPATSGKCNVSAATYAPDHNANKQRAPRTLSTKSKRFHAGVFISRKHSKANRGLGSPGPSMYFPMNGTIGACLSRQNVTAGVFK